MDRVATRAYSAQLVAIGAGVVLLPLRLHFLTKERIALWFVFLAIGAFAALLNAAIEPTVTRYASYARSGVSRPPSYGERPTDATGTLSPELLGATVAGAARLYRRAALLVFCVVGVLGGVYLDYLGRRAGMREEVTRAWLLYVAGLLLSTSFGHAEPILAGLDRMASLYEANIIYRGTVFAVAAAGVLAFKRLEAIGVAEVSAAIATRAFAMSRLSAALPRDLPKSDAPVVAREMMRGGVRLGLAQLGAFFVQRSNLLLASSFLGLAVAGSYAISQQLLEICSQLSATPVAYRVPALVDLRTRGQMPSFRRKVGRALGQSWISFVLLATGLVVLGGPLLTLIHSHTPPLPPAAFALMALTAFLELNHMLAANLLLADNVVPFMRSTLISGAAIASLSTCLLVLFPGAVWPLLLSQFFVQLAYNNWKWPLEAQRRFDLGLSDVLRGAATRSPQR